MYFYETSNKKITFPRNSYWTQDEWWYYITGLERTDFQKIGQLEKSTRSHNKRETCNGWTTLHTLEQNTCLGIWLTMVSSFNVDQFTSRFLVTNIKSDGLSLSMVHECSVFSRSLTASSTDLADDNTSGGDSIQLIACSSTKCIAHDVGAGGAGKEEMTFL